VFSQKIDLQSCDQWVKSMERYVPYLLLSQIFLHFPTTLEFRTVVYAVPLSICSFYVIMSRAKVS
jgi:hypothetical protein